MMSDREREDRTENFKVCVIDDDSEMVYTIERLLTARGYETLGLTETIGTSARLKKFHPHLVLIDVSMPALNGPTLLKLLRSSLDYHPKLVLFSAMPPEKLEKLALKIEADDFFYKGDGLFRLVGRVNLYAHEMKTTVGEEN